MVPSAAKTVLSTMPAPPGKNHPTLLFESPRANGGASAEKPMVFGKAIPSNFTSIALAPTALVGGTAAFYSAALGGSSTLAPLSIVYMLLLAVQYSIQPRISKKYLHPNINKRSVALVEEFVKFGMATAVLHVGYSTHDRKQALQNWSLVESAIVAGLPAALYAIQGVLYIFSYQNLDSVTFNGLTQTKMLWAALCCFFLLGQTQSPIQMVSLVLLAVSALLFQGTLGKMISSTTSKTTTSAAPLSTRFRLGILPCLLASFLSGLAGALSQKGLQMTGGAGRNAYLFTMEVTGFTALCLVTSMVLDRFKGKTDSFSKQKDVASSKQETNYYSSFFAHWSVSTLIPIALKAVGGVLTALVHKHAGSVAKGFALICGLVLSGVIQTLLDQERLSTEQVVGMILVNLSSWLHFTRPKL